MRLRVPNFVFSTEGAGAVVAAGVSAASRPMVWSARAAAPIMRVMVAVRLVVVIWGRVMFVVSVEVNQ